MAVRNFCRSAGAMTASSEVNVLLKAWTAGDRTALDRLMPMMYAEIHELAHRYIKRERPGNSMQTSALINEVYLKLVNIGDVGLRDRAHCFAISAQLMRRILVDAARSRSAAKRGGLARKVMHSSAVNLDEVADASSRRADEVIAVDDALTALAHLDSRRTNVVEMRFFGGLSVEETAQVLDLSPQTVMRDWKLARAWLMHELAQ